MSVPPLPALSARRFVVCPVWGSVGFVDTANSTPKNLVGVTIAVGGAVAGGVERRFGLGLVLPGDATRRRCPG